MKTVKLLILGILLSIFSEADAQISVNLDLGKPPVWGPTVTNQEYYFLPDIGSYYDIRESQFIYLNNGVWTRANTLPGKYRTYDLNSGNIVVLKDYKGRSPYINFKNHKVKYYKINNNWEKSKGGVKFQNNGNQGNNGKGNKGNKGNKKD